MIMFLIIEKLKKVFIEMMKSNQRCCKLCEGWNNSAIYRTILNILQFDRPDQNFRIQCVKWVSADTDKGGHEFGHLILWLQTLNLWHDLGLGHGRMPADLWVRH